MVRDITHVPVHGEDSLCICMSLFNFLQYIFVAFKCFYLGTYALVCMGNKASTLITILQLNLCHAFLSLAVIALYAK